LKQNDGTIHELYVNEDNDSPEYSNLRVYAKGTYTQKISFASYSNSIWISSPPLQRRLIGRLNSNEDMNWILSFTFKRNAPDGQQTVSQLYLASVSALHKIQLIKILNSNTSTVASQSDPISIPDMYYPVVKVAAADNPVPRKSFPGRNVEVQWRSEDGVSWWVVRSPDDTAYINQTVNDGNTVGCQISAGDLDGFCMVTVSDNIVAGLTSLGIGSYGITAVYIFVRHFNFFYHIFFLLIKHLVF